MKIAFIARNDGTDVRGGKICNSLVSLGHEVIFIGWDRQPEKEKTLYLDERVRAYIFKRPAGFGDLSAAGWPAWFRYIADVLRAERPAVAHVRDEQVAALVLPLRGRGYRYLVLDIFDSLAARKFGNPVVAAAAWATRKAAQIGADRIIETSDQLRAMLGPQASKAIVVMNVPADPGDELAAQLPDTPALQIATGGGLTRVRDGLETLLKAVELLPPGAVEIQASGWFFDDYSRDVFAKHPAVRYQWFDKPEEFRAQAARCDALTYLRGDATNSAYRAWVLPNRVFDAMSVGRPIIVSDALGIAGWVREQRLGYVVRHGDHQHLAELLRELRERRAELPAFSSRVRELFKRQYTWPVMEQRLGAFYQSLGA